MRPQQTRLARTRDRTRRGKNEFSPGTVSRRPARCPELGRTPPNVHGVRDLHGLVWEWVEDYSGLMVSSDSRDQGDPDRVKFCGAGALSTETRDEYAVLMRIALLSSLEANYTTANLGVRCASGGK